MNTKNRRAAQSPFAEHLRRVHEARFNARFAILRHGFWGLVLGSMVQWILYIGLYFGRGPLLEWAHTENSRFNTWVTPPLLDAAQYVVLAFALAGIAIGFCVGIASGFSKKRQYIYMVEDLEMKINLAKAVNRLVEIGEVWVSRSDTKAE